LAFSLSKVGISTDWTIYDTDFLVVDLLHTNDFSGSMTILILSTVVLGRFMAIAVSMTILEEAILALCTSEVEGIMGA
jgi:hypothetical protein